MTKEEIDRRKEELLVSISVPEVLSRYGVEVKRGRCKPFCHPCDRFNAKVSENFYYCYVCGKGMDIFDITKHFNHCDFWTAFELLGGTEKPSFTAVVKANKARRERQMQVARERRRKAELKQIQNRISVYRNLLDESEPFSNLWCYCQNKLQYQIYLLELHDEKR